MPASNTKIKKICEWCGTRFEAQKISTKYCSHRCANLAYKKREREKNIKATEENTQNRIEASKANHIYPVIPKTKTMRDFPL